YGDKYPRTTTGRLVAIIWIFASIIVISGFTGAIASSLTLGRMVSSVEEMDDLRRLSTGAVADSSASEYLRDHGVRNRNYPDIEAAMQALREGELDAVVHDAPILHYILDSKPLKGISLLRVEFGNLNYALAFPVDSSIARPVGIQLLREIEEPSWPSLVRRYVSSRR
ncbi:MAG: transporter substrate-binding domain-containing protein, partial [Phycisphaerales bacterium]|nr:transporter substrate-binding domain-containing protein [Phycisphaerales bacterium]